MRLRLKLLEIGIGMKEMFVKKEKRDSVGEREGVCEIERETESE